MLPFDCRGVLPVLKPFPTEGHGEVWSGEPDGAYFKVGGGYAQVIVVGVMHFAPGDYLDALNDLLEERFEHYYSTFLDPPEGPQRNVVLRRGFINLMFRKP